MKVNKHTLKSINLILSCCVKGINTKYAFVPDGVIFLSTKDKNKCIKLNRQLTKLLED